MSTLYADLPHLTEAEFDALVGAARARLASVYELLRRNVSDSPSD
ncbi:MULTISPECIES: hypothetical protein [Burkholderia]|nr:MULTISPECIES: hypothetical protein [Burkholderia]